MSVMVSLSLLQLLSLFSYEAAASASAGAASASPAPFFWARLARAAWMSASDGGILNRENQNENKDKPFCYKEK